MYLAGKSVLYQFTMEKGCTFLYSPIPKIKHCFEAPSCQTIETLLSNNSEFPNSFSWGLHLTSGVFCGTKALEEKSPQSASSVRIGICFNSTTLKFKGWQYQSPHFPFVTNFISIIIELNSICLSGTCFVIQNVLLG